MKSAPAHFSDKKILKTVFNKIFSRYAFNLKKGFSIEIEVDEYTKGVCVIIWENEARRIKEQYYIYADIPVSIDKELEVVMGELDKYKK